MGVFAQVIGREGGRGKEEVTGGRGNLKKKRIDTPASATIVIVFRLLSRFYCGIKSHFFQYLVQPRKN